MNTKELDTIGNALHAIQSQCAGHADEFSRRVYQHAADAVAAIQRIRADEMLRGRGDAPADDGEPAVDPNWQPRTL